MIQPVIKVEELNIHFAGVQVLDEFTWSVFPGEHWAISGESGSGKTVLARSLIGQLDFSGSVSFHFSKAPGIAAQAYYVPSWYQFTNLEGDRNFYYQQRYNRHQGQDTLTVYADLIHFGQKWGLDYEQVQPYLERFGYLDCRSNQLIELSSGEHKKLQIIKALWLKPEVLIVDEPYTGLDASSRKELNKCFDELSQQGVQLILIGNETVLPNCINRFGEMINGKLIVNTQPQRTENLPVRKIKPLPYFLKQIPPYQTDLLIDMKNVGVKYGEKEVLKGVNWQVRAGEKWLLQGPNGSGKSTLLSLLTGDHPQAYGTDLSLFGKKRGSGESIWEIKSKLGIISPEMHWYFDAKTPVWKSIASGFYDSVGLFQSLSYEKQKQVEGVLDFFELTPFKNQLLEHLPLGKQRLVLLARTIIKNPQILILDEPCQGLDRGQTQYFNQVVDELVVYGKTLIYVGHYESQIPSSIDNKIILENGKVKAVYKQIESIEK